MKPGYIRDKHNGTYYVVNRHGRAASIPVTVIGCSGGGGSGQSRNTRRYIKFADGSTLMLTTFEFMVNAGQLIRTT